MSFLKPTKDKLLATLAIYVSSLLSSWIQTGLTLILIPQTLLPQATQVVSELKETIDIPLRVVIGVSIASFVLRILLFYIAASFILAIARRNQRDL